MRLDDPISHYRIDAEQFDYFAEGSGPDRDSARRIQEGVMHLAHIAREHRVLDAGSGNGWLISRRSEAGSGMTVCVDLGIANLQKIRSLHGPGTALVVCDITRLPFCDGSFHRVIASEVLEHINDPASAVNNLAAVLQPGGRLTVSTPYREKLLTYLCVHCNQKTTVNAHLHSFDEQLIGGLFSDAGLQGFRHALFQNKLFVMSRLSWALKFLPFGLWKIVDRLITFVYHKPSTIVAAGNKLQ